MPTVTTPYSTLKKPESIKSLSDLSNPVFSVRQFQENCHKTSRTAREFWAVVSVKCNSMKCPEEIQQNFSARNFNVETT
jgi:hypothetical protein